MELEDSDEDDDTGAMREKRPTSGVGGDDRRGMEGSMNGINKTLAKQLREVRASLNLAYEQSLRFSEHARVVQQAEIEIERLMSEKTCIPGSSDDVVSAKLRRFTSDDSIEIAEETQIVPALTDESQPSQGVEVVPLPPTGHPRGSPAPPPLEQPPSLPQGSSEGVSSTGPMPPSGQPPSLQWDSPEREGVQPTPPPGHLKERTKREHAEDNGDVPGFSIVPTSVPFQSDQSQVNGEAVRKMELQDVPDMPTFQDDQQSRQSGRSLCSGSSRRDHQSGVSKPQLQPLHTQDVSGVHVFEVHDIWGLNTMNAAVMISERQSVAPWGQRDSEDANFTDVMSGPRPSLTNDFPQPSAGNRCVLHPYSPVRAAWDGVSLLLVIYDLVMIPFALFEPPETFFLELMNWVTRIFWTVDVFMSLITGLTLDDGHIELRLRIIIRRYLKQWFILDIIIVGSDWGEYILRGSLLDNNASGYAKAGKAGRAFRIIRMLRLLRLARMREVIDLMLERIRSERVIILAGALRMTAIIMSLAHIIACVWWGIGTSDDENSWVIKADYERQALFYKYFMTLHWSLSQFAGGMDEITPANTGERCYTILIFLTCFVAAAAFVSTLTSSMTQLNIIGSQHSQQLSQMRKYLYQNGISNRLALRVMRNAKHAVHEQQRMMPEDNVPLLKVVSEPLRLELHFEMFSPILNMHPWMQRYSVECPQVMRKVCHHATTFQIVSTGDVLFSCDEIPKTPVMYIVVYGDLTYEKHGKEMEVKVGRSISEATLWTPQWMHRGVLTATSDCRLCLLDAKEFQDIAGNFHHRDFNPRVYANGFVNALNEMDEKEVSDLVFFDHLLPRRGRTRTFSRALTTVKVAPLDNPSQEEASAPNKSIWQRFSGVVRRS